MSTVELDHYIVLGLPSGEEGAKLTEKEISKAYKLKALELHPDKRPGDPNAHADFQKLRSSYETLIDPAARSQFDESLRQHKERMEAEKKRKFMHQKWMDEAKRRKQEAEEKEGSLEADLKMLDDCLKENVEHLLAVPDKLMDEEKHTYGDIFFRGAKRRNSFRRRKHPYSKFNKWN
ncbi:hypothetical protein Tsubulata_021094 [Turnera subulata]|uniref:J domain-containing protein n=1 Tax=Turnera subulata TaxID=218843 RepID=A0A9Q0GFX6_9ROSI|nr:hypothetical protein Tsubulata_021094 [Turnera subulata]